MSAPTRVGLQQDSFVRRHCVLAYFLLTFGISWLGAQAVAAPGIIRGYGVSKTTGIVMFPVMLLGPSVSGTALTWAIDGREGLRDLFARMRRARVGAPWYTILLIPPVLVLSILFLLKSLVSPAFAPNRFYLGILFGVPAGILEEIGWMGYAFPKMGLHAAHLKLRFCWERYGDSGICRSLTTWGRQLPTALAGCTSFSRSCSR